MYNKTSIDRLVSMYGSQKLSTHTIKNARDLGGYYTKDGYRTRYGLLLRSAELHNASDSDIEQLHLKYNIRLIVDLRSSKETTLASDPSIPGACAKNIPLINKQAISEKMLCVPEYKKLVPISRDPLSQIEAAKALISSGYFDSMYIDYIASSYTQSQLANIFRELLTCEDGGILWHCKEGKDRTGIVSALLLSVLGVDYDTIIADFELSNLFYRVDLHTIERLLQILNYSKEESDLITAFFTGVHSSLLERAWQYMENGWGSVKRFVIEQLGISEHDIECLRMRYLCQ